MSTDVCKYIYIQNINATNIVINIVYNVFEGETRVCRTTQPAVTRIVSFNIVKR